MPTEAKRETVAELVQEARGSTAMIVSEYRGLKVSELGDIRRTLRKQDVTYHVVKNRLMKIAASEVGAERLSLLLEGPSAVAFGSGDETAVARAVLDALRPYRIVKIKGGLVGKSQVVDADGVTRLSQLPSRDVLLAQVAGALTASLATMAGLLDAPARNVAGLVQALEERQQQSA